LRSLVRKPTMLFTVSSAWWSSTFTGVPRFPEGSEYRLSEFRLPPEYYPVDPSLSAAALQLLSWTLAPLQHMSGPEVLNAAGFQLCRPLRLQGLVTLLAYLPLWTPVSFISHSQRSWGSPFGVSSPLRICLHLCSIPPTYCFLCP
jgi:hypothetical protein